MPGHEKCCNFIRTGEIHPQFYTIRKKTLITLATFACFGVASAATFVDPYDFKSWESGTLDDVHGQAPIDTSYEGTLASSYTMVLVLNWDELEKASSSHPGTHVLNMWGNNTSNGLKMWKYNDSTILTSIWVDDYQQYPLTEGSNATWLSESDKNNYAITKDEYALQLEGYDSDMFVVALTNDGNGMVTVNVLKNDMQTVGSAYVMDSSVPTASFTMAGFYTDTAAVHKAILFDDVLTAEQLAYVAVQSGLTVPEPATASLSLLGLAALMMRRRRA